MEQDFSHYTLKELREMSEVINRAINQQRMALRDTRFNAMIKAISEFAEVCPDAMVYDNEYSYPIGAMADGDNWAFAGK